MSKTRSFFTLNDMDEIISISKGIEQIMVKTSFLFLSWSMENIGHRDVTTGSSSRIQFLVLFNFFVLKIR